jgi:hypothetical protein
VSDRELAHQLGDQLDDDGEAEHRYDGVVVACNPVPEAIEELLRPPPFAARMLTSYEVHIAYER